MVVIDNSFLAFSFSILAISFSFSFTHGARFDITNKCPHTVWAAALPGGGRQLDSGETWSLNLAAGTTGARIWGRTNCSFNGSGHGRCQTGDCGGLLQCQASGTPPTTLTEFSLNQNGDSDFFDISLVDGFNLPIEFSPTSSDQCRGVRCAADINGQCLYELRAPGGCNNPCSSANCGPTNYSRFFKERCPDAYSYAQDDASSTFTCPGGTDYRVVFCPGDQDDSISKFKMCVYFS